MIFPRDVTIETVGADDAAYPWALRSGIDPRDVHPAKAAHLTSLYAPLTSDRPPRGMIAKAHVGLYAAVVRQLVDRGVRQVFRPVNAKSSRLCIYSGRLLKLKATLRARRKRGAKS